MRCLVRKMRRVALAVTAVAVMATTSPWVIARESSSADSFHDSAHSNNAIWRQAEFATVSAASLPPAALRVLSMIRDGGHFAYEKDGAVFGNRERRLPRQPRGYYREYTVPTPWARDRGARRIVCGGPPRETDECYYTDDHYNSFKRIQG